MSETTMRLPRLGKLLDRKRSELGQLQKLYDERREQLRLRRDELRAELRHVEAEISACARDARTPRKNSASPSRTETKARQAGDGAKRHGPAATNRRNPASKSSHTSSTPPRSGHPRLRNLEKVAATVLRNADAIYMHEKNGFLTESGEDRNA
jgi:hypothetical protein